MSRVTEFIDSSKYGRTEQNMRSLYALSKGDPNLNIKVASLDIKAYAERFEAINDCKVTYSGKDNIYSIKIVEPNQ